MCLGARSIWTRLYRFRRWGRMTGSPTPAGRDDDVARRMSASPKLIPTELRHGKVACDEVSNQRIKMQESAIHV